MTDRAVTLYRQFIDGMVERSRYSIAADRIREHGHAERINDRDCPLSAEEATRKAALLSMTDDQRAAVVELLLKEQVNGAHSAIHHLSDFDFAIAGKKPEDLADGWPSGDFMARLEGEYEWLEIH